MKSYFGLLALLGSPLLAASAMDVKTGSGGLAVYWGQNSLSLQTGTNEMDLDKYCTQSNPPDIILLSFHHVYTSNPTINLAYHCEDTFSGSSMLNCTFMAPQIKTCQDKGIKILISMGGAAGSYSLGSSSVGSSYAQTVYDTFLGGTTTNRPFGDAVLDGVDLDIEGGGPTGYAAFSNKVHELSPSSLITGAPQCPYPDAQLSEALESGWFDIIFVQFYNNYCSAGTSSFNFDTWADWATSKSKNSAVKVYIGSPACAKCASSGYIGVDKLGQVYQDTLSKFSNVLGGVMLWDAGAAYYSTSGDTFADKLKKSYLGSSSGGGGGSSSAGSPSSSAESLSAESLSAESSSAESSSAASSSADSSSASESTSASTSATVPNDGSDTTGGGDDDEGVLTATSYFVVTINSPPSATSTAALNVRDGDQNGVPVAGLPIPGMAKRAAEPIMYTRVPRLHQFSHPDPPRH
ncbi:Chitinase 2 [Linderina macrospora]|uniref:Chitinase 2 n=1 Tax=Linderina macrospora TaxID=4868 RepID=A0ACC1J7T5_9FUNG|nr:Chitinase 2 [Linderina macrospora]